MSAAPTAVDETMAPVSKLPSVSASEAAVLEQLKSQVVAAMDLLEDGRLENEKDDDYYHDNQWTPDERRILEARKQPAITFNQIKTAINAIIGIIEGSKTDPQAWGRTPKDQNSAEIATQMLRYSADANQFQTKVSACSKDFLVWGVCASIVEVGPDRFPEVRKIRPEEYFYDPYSREFDFSDARYDGIAKWMDEVDIIDLYPDKADEIKSSIDGAQALSETYKDRPDRAWTWANRKTRRVMVFEMYKMFSGEWYKIVFVSGAILESGISPYKDNRGKSKKPIIAQGAYINRQNTRYGAVRTMRGAQDAINKTRSKAVHLLNVNKLRVDPNVLDVDKIRAEYAKPDGIIEAREGQITELSGKEFVPAHLELMRDAKGEMQYLSPSPGIVGRQNKNQSGKAILAEQRAGLIEQTPLLSRFNDWQLRNYRAFWECIRQYCTEPQYIRVTDDPEAPKFIMMNEPALLVGPDGNPVMDPNTGKPAIDPRVPPRNAPAEMDMDIIIDVSPDTAALQEEQFTRLTELMQAGVQFPPEVLIESSSLPNKRLLLQKLKAAQEEAKANPPQDPAIVKAQLDAKQAEADAAAQAQQAQADAASEAKAAADKAALNKQEHDDKMAEMARKEAFEVSKFNRQMALEDKKANNQMVVENRKMDVAEKAASKKDAPAVGISMSEKGEMAIAHAQAEGATAMQQAAEAMTATAAALAQLAQIASQPKMLVKDAQGNKSVIPFPQKARA